MPESQARVPVIHNYDDIRRNLERFSNIAHRRVLSDQDVPESARNTDFPQQFQLTDRPASVLLTKDKIAVALGTTRHPFLTRKRREFR